MRSRWRRRRSRAMLRFSCFLWRGSSWRMSGATYSASSSRSWRSVIGGGPFGDQVVLVVVDVIPDVELPTLGQADQRQRVGGGHVVGVDGALVAVEARLHALVEL